MTQGIKKINEYLIQNNRGLLLSEDITKSITQGQWNNIGDGTLYVDCAVGSLKYKAGSEIKWTSLDPSKMFESKSINGSLLKDNTIIAGKLGENSIVTSNLTDRCVTGDKIANGTIATSNLAENISGEKIAKGSIPIDRLTSTELSELPTNIPDGYIEARHMAANSIVSDSIVSKAITEEKYADGSIPASAFKKNSIDASSSLKDESISSAKLGVACVIEKNMASNSVSSAALKDSCVIESKLNAECVSSSKIQNGAVTETKYADNSISSSKYQNGSITLDKLSTELKDTIDKINNAVVYSNGKVTITGDLTTSGNIVALKTDKSQIISGYKVYNPVFCDMAEAFEADEDVEPGDIVQINEHGHIIKCTGDPWETPIGVVSDMYASCYGASEAEIKSGEKVPVGLIGQVYVKVKGDASIGDLITPCKSGDGYGEAVWKGYAKKTGNKIGIVLRNKDPQTEKVLCLIK